MGWGKNEGVRKAGKGLVKKIVIKNKSIK